MRRIIVVILAFVLVACGNNEQAKEPQSEGTVATSNIRSVKITTAISEQRDVDVVEEALGRILDPSATTISAEIPARVSKVMFDAGDRVNKGDILAKLDKSDAQVVVATTAAHLARSKAQEKAQFRLVERYRKLADDKFVSTSMLDQAEAELVSLQKAAKAAEAQFKQANNNLARTIILAPVSGTLQQRFVAAGDYIGVGKPMFRLATDDHFVISITIPETKAQTVKAGLPVRMHLPGSDQVVQGSIAELTPMIGSASNAFEARVKISNPGNWRPGGSVIVELIVETHKQSVVVPEECIVLRPVGDVVYVIAEGQATAKPVRTGVRKHGYVEVMGGLNAGVTLAATGASFLSDGAKVKIQGSLQ